MTDEHKDQERMADRNDFEDADLDALFALERRNTPAPRIDFLSAILADAAEVSALREGPAPSPRRRAAPRHPFGAVGGWRGATALTACALVGFWLGQAGMADFGGGDVASEILDTAALTDPVGSFFDLAAAEG